MENTTRYDTATVAPRHRFSFWRDAVCESFVQLGCEADNRTTFSGSIDIARHSVLSVSDVTGNAHAVERRRQHVRSAESEFFLLSLQRNGTSRISQYGNSALLRPGDMAIYDSSAPYRLELHEGFAKTVVQVPRERLVARVPSAQMLAGRLIDGQSGVGLLVRQTILAFARQVDAENLGLEAIVQDTLIDLIATGLAYTAGMTASLSSPEQGVLLRAKVWIRQHLADPDMDRNGVAAALGMSVRRLNAIFAKEGSSLSNFIREERLNAVAHELTDRRFDRLSVAEIALQNGFSNFQHFSTLFKSRYAFAPSAWRRLAPR